MTWSSAVSSIVPTRRVRIASACACSNSATWSRLDCRCARRRWSRCASCTASTGQTVNLSVRQGDEIVYVDRSYSERSGMQVVRAIGGRAPLHLTSSGKLFLALDDPRSFARMRRAPGSPGTRATASPRSPDSNENCRRYARAATRGTTKNSNSACAVSLPAFATIRGGWWRGCRYRRRRSACRTTGLQS